MIQKTAQRRINFSSTSGAGGTNRRRNKAHLLYLTVILIAFMTALLMLTGCSGGGGSPSGVGSELNVRTRPQKYSEDKEIKWSPTKMFIRTSSGWVDISPGMEPDNSVFTNSKYYFIPTIDRNPSGESENTTRGRMDFPDLPMFQHFVRPDPGGGEGTDDFGNLKKDDVETDGITLKQPAITPYGIDETPKIPPEYAHHMDVYTRHGLQFDNPGPPTSTLYSFVTESPIGKTYEYTIKYKSWKDEDGVWHYDMWTYNQGEEWSHFGEQIGFMNQLDVINGHGNGISGTYQKKVFRLVTGDDSVISAAGGSTILARNYKQRRIWMTKDPEEIEFTVGDKVMFEGNSMIWNESPGTPSGPAPIPKDPNDPTQLNDDPKWKLAIYDGDQLLTTLECDGVQLAIEWDTSGLGGVAVASRAGGLRHGRKIRLVPGSKHGRAPASRGDDEGPELNYSLIADAAGHKNTVGGTPSRSAYVKGGIALANQSTPIDVTKIDFKTNKVKIKDVDKKLPQFEKTTTDPKINPAAFPIDGKIPTQAFITFKARSSITGTKKYIVAGKITLNDDVPKADQELFLFLSSKPLVIKASEEKKVWYSTVSAGGNPKSISLPDSIQKVDKIKWHVWELAEDGSYLRAIPLDDTDVQLFFILKKPVQAMKKEVWKDFLEIACSGAEGESDPTIVKNKLLEVEWTWMNNNISYEDLSNVEGKGGKMKFDYSKMLLTRKGCCRDSAAMFQILCNCIGLHMYIKTTEITGKKAFFMEWIKVFNIANQLMDNSNFYGNHSFCVYPGSTKGAPTETDLVYETMVAKVKRIINPGPHTPTYEFYDFEGLRFNVYLQRFFQLPLPPHKWYRIGEIVLK